MGWIKVEDKLPCVGERVLFVTGGNFVGEGYIKTNKEWHRFVGVSVFEMFKEDVLAWMPMPKYNIEEI